METALLHFLFRIVGVTGFAAGVLDGMSTVKAISHGAREANPGWAYVIRQAGTDVFFVARVLFALAIFTLGVFAGFSWLGLIGGAIGDAVILYVAHRNNGIANKLREAKRARQE